MYTMIDRDYIIYKIDDTHGVYIDNMIYLVMCVCKL